jgi:glycosyltransferase involved in cell wall biosynthesis
MVSYYRANAFVFIKQLKENDMNDMNPNISVIVAIYNKESFLRRCVDSILTQTYRELEILLVDDGSTDSCGALCDAYAARNDRVRVIHKKNGGLSSARNAGLDVCQGDYIGFVDADDYLLPEMYETLFKMMGRHDADIAQISYYREENGVREPISFTKKTVVMEGYDALFNFYTTAQSRRAFAETRYSLPDDFKYQITYTVWNKLYRKNIIQDMRFRTDITLMEDVAFNFEAFSRKPRVALSDTPLYVYDINDASSTQEKSIHYIKKRTAGIIPLHDLVVRCMPTMENYAYIYFVRETAVALCKLIALVGYQTQEEQTLLIELRGRLRKAVKDAHYSAVTRSLRTLITAELHLPLPIMNLLGKILLRTLT